MNRNRFDDIPATTAPLAMIISQTAAMALAAKYSVVHVALKDICVQLTQHIMGNIEMTKLRRANDVEMEPAPSPAEDYEGNFLRPRGPNGPRIRERSSRNEPQVNNYVTGWAKRSLQAFQ